MHHNLDSTGGFEFRLSPRARRTYIVVGAVALSPAAGYAVVGGADSVGAALVLAFWAIGFGGMMAHGAFKAVRVSHRRFDRRYLAIWISKPLPLDVMYTPDPRVDRYESVWRAHLEAPPAIAVLNLSNGKRVARIEPDFLAGMSSSDYDDLLEALNEMSRKRSSSEWPQQ